LMYFFLVCCAKKNLATLTKTLTAD
jgi:hypothetical protein